MTPEKPADTLSRPGAAQFDPVALEKKRLSHVLSLFGWVGIFILVTISLVNHLNEADAFLLLTLPAAAATLLALVYKRLSGNTGITAHTFAVLMLALSIVLTISGGVGGNGTLWIYIFPPFFLYMLGLRGGMVYIALVMGAVAVVFYCPFLPFDHFIYPSQYKLRFLLSLAGVSMISAFSEYSRHGIHLRLAALAAKLERQSLQDELTGLANRRGGLNQLRAIRQISLRNGNPFSIILGDLDHFKSVNDRFGHEAGDAILRQCARAMNAVVRGQDLLVRWGGEEFLCLLPNTGLSGALLVAEKLRRAVAERPCETGGHTLGITASFGVAQFQTGEELDTTLARADTFLYQSKESGRDRVSGGPQLPSAG